MARVTIEDCLAQISSRFDLVLIASKRARQLTRGAEPTQAWDGHKSTVLALREVAEGQVTAAVLKEVDLPLPKADGPNLDLLDLSLDA